MSSSRIFKTPPRLSSYNKFYKNCYRTFPFISKFSIQKTKKSLWQCEARVYKKIGINRIGVDLGKPCVDKISSPHPYIFGHLQKKIVTLFQTDKSKQKMVLVILTSLWKISKQKLIFSRDGFPNWFICFFNSLGAGCSAAAPSGCIVQCLLLSFQRRVQWLLSGRCHITVTHSPCGKFHRIGGALLEAFHYLKYDASKVKEVGGNRKCFDSPISKWGLILILYVNSNRVLALYSLTVFCCR